MCTGAGSQPVRHLLKIRRQWQRARDFEMLRRLSERTPASSSSRIHVVGCGLHVPRRFNRACMRRSCRKIRSPPMILTLILLFVSLLLPLRRAAQPQQPPPPVAGDEMVFQPTDKIYPRSPHSVQGRVSILGSDHIVASWPTVADAAQVYADFSRKEVRVPRALLERKLAFGSGAGSVASDYVVKSLDWQLPYDGVDIARLGRGVIGFRAGHSPQEKAAAERPPEASLEEIARAREVMPVERFWSLIGRTRGATGKDCFKKAAALQATLQRLSAEEIVGFQVRFEECMAESYRWDIWGVAYLVNGGASDDGFEYFRAWLIGQGREYYEAALRNPERAADRASNRQDNECEQLMYCALEAHEAKTKRPLPLVRLDRASQPAGTAWSDADLPRLFPTVAKRFR